jgi:hypothetical protein
MNARTFRPRIPSTAFGEPPLHRALEGQPRLPDRFHLAGFDKRPLDGGVDAFEDAHGVVMPDHRAHSVGAAAVVIPVQLRHHVRDRLRLLSAEPAR